MTSTTSGVRTRVHDDLAATEIICHSLIDAATAIRANVDLLADPAMGSPETRADVASEALRAAERIAEIARGLRTSARARAA